MVNLRMVLRGNSLQHNPQTALDQMVFSNGQPKRTQRQAQNGRIDKVDTVQTEAARGLYVFDAAREGTIE
jgi:hypothetical protein